MPNLLYFFKNLFIFSFGCVQSAFINVTSCESKKSETVFEFKTLILLNLQVMHQSAVISKKTISLLAIISGIPLVLKSNQLLLL